MEFFGFFAFVLVVWNMSVSNKVKKLEKKVKKLEKQKKGESAMSKMIEELVGKKCRISSEEGFNFTEETQIECYVMDYDKEWLKISFRDEKQNEMIEMIREEKIDEIEILKECE